MGLELGRWTGRRAATVVLALAALGATAAAAPAGPGDDVRLSIHPGGGAQPAGGSQTIEVRAMLPDGAGAAGVEVDLEITEGPGDDDTGTAGHTPGQPDLGCTTSSGGPGWAATCTVSYSELDNAGGTDVVLAWVDEDGSDATVEADLGEGVNSGPHGSAACTAASSGDGDEAEPDATDCAEKRWTARTPAVVDLEPESIDGVVGDEATLRASVHDQFGEPFAYPAEVHFELLAGSVNDSGDGSDLAAPDLGRCTTAAAAACSVALGARGQGSDRVCAYLGDARDACAEPADAPERADGADVATYVWTAPPDGSKETLAPEPTPQPDATDEPEPDAAEGGGDPREEEPRRDAERPGDQREDGEAGGAPVPPPEGGGPANGAPEAPARSDSRGASVDARGAAGRAPAGGPPRGDLALARAERVAPGAARPGSHSRPPSHPAARASTRARASSPDGPKLVERLSEAALATAERFSFPLVLVLLVALFLTIQSRIDRRDPKLRLAPVDAKHDLLHFA